MRRFWKKRRSKVLQDKERETRSILVLAFTLGCRPYSQLLRLYQGQVGMLVGETDTLRRFAMLATIGGQKVSPNFSAITRLPRLASVPSDYSPATVITIGMTIGSQHPVEAWELLKYMIGPEGARITAACSLCLCTKVRK